MRWLADALPLLLEQEGGAPLMAWVRYDDNFHCHPKVTAAVYEDPRAIALHVLALTWSNAQKRPGFVPSHQPGILLADKQTGKQMAAILVSVGLWEETEGGWLFHDHDKYRAPARDRTTPGTPAELSEKRRAAGQKGGRASAAKRAGKREVSNVPPADQAQGQASEANGVSKSSNLLSCWVSPEPVPEVQEQEKTSSSLLSDSASPASDVILLRPASDDTFDVFWSAYPRKVAKANALKAWQKLIKKGVDPQKIIAGACRYRDDPRRLQADVKYTAHPATWLNGERFNDEPEAPPLFGALPEAVGGPPPRTSTTDQRVAEGLALAERLAERGM
ncbi:hypothetical protein [Streptomyces sp. NPDC093261]|uniref:hypothetical protein n=1 Tax=Streptomyces sp. NPDC093261 TaxID=3366037 RepID=UPI00382D4DAA